MSHAARMPRLDLISECEERAARQAAATVKRGGGERGSIDREKSDGFDKWIADSKVAGLEMFTEAGNKNTTGVIAGRSGF